MPPRVRRRSAYGRCARAGVGRCWRSAAAPPPRRTSPRWSAHRITLDQNAAVAAALGPLRLEAAFVLGSADPRFGGLSGLWLAPDGSGADRGERSRHALARAPRPPRRRPARRLRGLAGDRARRGAGRSGRSATPRRSRPIGADGLVIAYEGAHRLRRLALGALDAAATRAARPCPAWSSPATPASRRWRRCRTARCWRWPRAGSRPSGDLAAWLVEGARALAAELCRERRFRADRRRPAGPGDLRGRAAVLAARRLRDPHRGAARRRGAPRRAAGPAAGRAVARAAGGENFEAIAARRGPDGRVLLYLLADDNFIALQRTLLLQLSLEPARAPADRHAPAVAGGP